MVIKMKRVNRIFENEKYRSHINKTAEFEKKRKFCRHDMVHFMNVARIAQIFNLEERLEIPKDVIYAAALLHDVGRDVQYMDGTPHEIAGAAIAPEILRECGYGPDEVSEILRAVRGHRNEEIKEEKSLSGILYRADKLSRDCYACAAKKECDWKGGKKNEKIVI